MTDGVGTVVAYQTRLVRGEGSQPSPRAATSVYDLDGLVHQVLVHDCIPEWPIRHLILQADTATRGGHKTPVTFAGDRRSACP